MACTCMLCEYFKCSQTISNRHSLLISEQILSESSVFQLCENLVQAKVMENLNIG